MRTFSIVSSAMTLSSANGMPQPMRSLRGAVEMETKVPLNAGEEHRFLSLFGQKNEKKVLSAWDPNASPKKIPNLLKQGKSNVPPQKKNIWAKLPTTKTQFLNLQEAGDLDKYTKWKLSQQTETSAQKVLKNMENVFSIAKKGV